MSAITNARRAALQRQQNVQSTENALRDFGIAHDQAARVLPHFDIIVWEGFDVAFRLNGTEAERTDGLRNQWRGHIQIASRDLRGALDSLRVCAGRLLHAQYVCALRGYARRHEDLVGPVPPYAPQDVQGVPSYAPANALPDLASTAGPLTPYDTARASCARLLRGVANAVLEELARAYGANRHSVQATTRAAAESHASVRRAITDVQGAVEDLERVAVQALLTQFDDAADGLAPSAQDARAPFQPYVSYVSDDGAAAETGGEDLGGASATGKCSSIFLCTLFSLLAAGQSTA